MSMKNIIIPNTYNYIASFLTFSCNYHCSYCINYFGESKFVKKILSGEKWVKRLNRIISRDDLAITLQGGEPSLHPDFIYIINNLKPELKIDILTNLQFDVDKFINKIDPNRIKRKSPYASIRVSFHPEHMDINKIIDKTIKLQNAGFYIGIWGVMHPTYKKEILSAQEKCRKLNIDFRTKELLGEYTGTLYGTYKYNNACSKKFTKQVKCKTTELIIGTYGYIYRCHSDLYEGRKPIGNLLDDEFKIEDKFRKCNFFGYCNPCDIKIKTNRFQKFGHTSVEIKFE